MLALALALTSSFFPQGVRISPELPRSALGDVEDFQLDGVGGVLFRGDCTRDGQLDLYRARLDGSLLQTRISLPNLLGVESYRLSPDGQRVVFETPLGLHSAPLDGSLAPVLLVGATVLNYTITPDSSTVLYGIALHDLHSVPITGGPGTLLESVGATSFVGGDFAPSADSSRALYRIKNGGEFELRSQPVGGGPSILHADLGTVADFRLSSDGTEILFRSTSTQARTSLQRVPHAGGTPLELSPPLVRGASVLADYTFDRARTRALFRATTLPDTDPSATSELWLAPLDGSTPAVKVSAPLPTGADVLDFRFDDARILYRATGPGGIIELFSVPLDVPQGSVRLSRASDVFSWGGSVGTFGVSPDGSVAVLLATSGASPVVVSSSLAHPAPIERSLPETPGSTLLELAFTPDSNAFVYTIAAPGGQARLMAASTRTREPSLRLDAPPVAGSPHDLVLGPGSARVFYLAPSTTRASELFTSFLDGRFPPATLNGPLMASGRVRAFELAPDGARLIYLADQEVLNRIGLYAVDALGGPALRLDGGLDPGEDVLAARIAPDSRHALFVADDVLAGTDNLYVVPLDGSAAPLPLTDHASGAHSVALLAFTPDGAGAVYRVRFPDGAAELRRVALDGSGASILLDGDAFDPTELAFTADGTRVVYRLVSSGSLRSARLDGSVGALELDDLISIDSAGHQLTADSAHVVYRKNQQLWQARVDGSTAPLRLGATLGQVNRHELTRTGRILAGTYTQLFVFETLTATPRFLAPLDSTQRFLASPEGRRVLSVNGELYLDYLTRPHLPR